MDPDSFICAFTGRNELSLVLRKESPGLANRGNVLHQDLMFYVSVLQVVICAIAVLFQTNQPLLF